MTERLLPQARIGRMRRDPGWSDLAEFGASGAWWLDPNEQTSPMRSLGRQVQPGNGGAGII